nr:glycosyltransferase [Motilibacter deserti]
MTAPRVALISLEPWDEVWRRNQHLSAQLVMQGLADRLLFVEPPAWRPAPLRRPMPKVTVVQPRRTVLKRAGGNTLVGTQLRLGALRRADLLWVNDPEVGAAAVRRGQPAVYDVTDDWREMASLPRIVRRIVRAEDRLAGTARTTVCSLELQSRWRARYGVEAPVINNGIDAAAWAAPSPRPLTGPGPHVGYVGTLHEERLDVDLTLELARHPAVGTLHLVGPHALDAQSHSRLAAEDKVELHGPVPAADVPSWMAALDMLLCPHRITPFTMSLDAIKSYEYLASGRPVVATPTSGFQHLRAPQLTVVGVEGFVEAVVATLASPPAAADRSVGSWAQRAREFAAAWPPLATAGG